MKVEKAISRLSPLRLLVSTSVWSSCELSGKLSSRLRQLDCCFLFVGWCWCWCGVGVGAGVGVGVGVVLCCVMLCLRDQKQRGKNG